VQEAPLVTIAMPVYNAKATVKLAIQSILLQTYNEWELFVVDDGSNDETLGEIADQVNDPRIKIVSDCENKGLAVRLNQIIDLARGEYFARLDADDLAYPWRLERQVEFLQKNRTVDLLGTGAMVFADNGKPIGRFPLREKHEEICRTPLSGFYLAHPTWMGKTVWFRRHKYNPSMLKAQDQELLLRTFRKSTFACLPEILTGYRQTTLSLRKTLKGRYQFSKALIQNIGSEKKVPLLQALILQAMKAVYDTFSITAQLNHKLLKHRALPANADEIQLWKDLWLKVNGLQ